MKLLINGFTTSYLTDRNQCIAIRNVKSYFVQTAKGIAQGSILRPALFALYIDDVASSVNGCNTHLISNLFYCIAANVHSVLY